VANSVSHQTYDLLSQQFCNVVEAAFLKPGDLIFEDFDERLNAYMIISVYKRYLHDNIYDFVFVRLGSTNVIQSKCTVNCKFDVFKSK